MRLLPRRVVALIIAVLSVASLCVAQGDSARCDIRAVRITPKQFSRLRHAVIPDLIRYLNTRDGNAAATEQDATEELQGCTFTPLQLGKLGPAILVTDNNGAASNFNFLAVYAERNGAYYKLVDGAGFIGFLDGPGPVPDIVFTWASGVCHAMYYRMRYKSGEYQEDACDQEYEPTEGQSDCVIRACETPSKPLPMFPSPYKPTDDVAEVACQTPKYIVGPEVTARSFDSSARVKSRP